MSKAFKENTFWFADLGSGPGHNAIYIATLRSDVRGVLIDSSLEMLTKFLRNSPEELLHRLYPVLADMEFPPLRSKSLDSLLLIASLHHIIPRSSRLRVLSECYRVLKNYGLLIVVVWSRWQLSLVLDALKDVHSYILRRKDSLWDIIRCSRITCRRYHLYSMKELEKDLLEAGFKMLEKGVYIPQDKSGVPNKNYYCLTFKTEGT